MAIPELARINVFSSLDSLRDRTIALAVSGGVDSMALATLCSQHKIYRSRPRPFGFIVDHGVRAESHYEAKNVAYELRRLGMRARILKLDWSTHGDPRTLSNFETIARMLRYQALGRACSAWHVQSLLLGHHQDDCAETTLARLITGYAGNLTGMKSNRPIPECEGIYGVHESGHPYRPLRQTGSKASQDMHEAPQYMCMESGGVRVHRPLLTFKKDELKQICTAAGTKWFEDQTNADCTLTLRNTIRHLQSTSQLPAALQNDRVAQVASRLSARNVTHERKAKALFDTLSIKFIPAIGTAVLDQPSSIEVDALEPGAEYHIKALVTKKVLELVSPISALSLQDLDLAVDALFLPNWSGKIQAAKVDLTRIKTPSDDHKNFSKKIMVHRSRPNRGIAVTLPDVVLPKICAPCDRPMDMTWSGWILFDNRFWIRIRSGSLPRLHASNCYTNSQCSHIKGVEADQDRRSEGPPEKPRPLVRENAVAIPGAQDYRFSIRFLDADMMRSLNDITRRNKRARDALQTCFKAAAPGDLRWNLPIILSRKKSNSTEEVLQEADEIFSLPSLDWQNRENSAVMEGWVSQIRSKSVDFGDGKKHVFEPIPKTRIIEKQKREEREGKEHPS